MSTLAREYTGALRHRRVETREGRLEVLIRPGAFGLKGAILYCEECA